MTIESDIRNGLLELKCGLASVAAELKFRKLLHAVRVKFDPAQPRDEAGRWTDGRSTTGVGSVIGDAASVLLAAGRQSAAFCWNQMQIDMLLCGSLQPASRRAICRAQANQRYGACLAGTQIPPLSY